MFVMVVPCRFWGCSESINQREEQSAVLLTENPLLAVLLAWEKEAIDAWASICHL